MYHSDNFYNYMACMDSFFLNEVSQYSIVANENSIVVRTEAETIEKFKQIPAFLSFYQFYIEKTFLFTESIRNNLLAMTSEDYLRWLYCNHPYIFKRFQSQSIASIMGITPVWYSKLKKRVIS